MWSTFVTMMKVNLREKSSLFWLFAFPLILATMFNGMFTNLHEAYEISPEKFICVENADWKAPANDGGRELIDQLTNEGDYGKVLTTISSPSVSQAKKALAHDDQIRGFITADNAGKLNMVVTEHTAAEASSLTGGSSLIVSINILHSILNQYNDRFETMNAIAQEAHGLAVLRDPQFMERVQQIYEQQPSREITLTHFKPDEACRYFFALLGIASMMAMSFAMNAVLFCQANVSALGLRRSVSPQSKLSQLTAGFLASWICACLTMLVTALYIRYGCQVSYGGREAAALLAVIVAALASCAIGTLIGALPRLSTGVKGGLTIAIPCVLALFAGLYGTPAMQLSDWTQQHTPVLSAMNPVQQVTNLFYDILYFDSYTPFFRTVGILLVMTVVCLGLSTVLLRKQRYEHL